ncbi:MAG: hypothetical protein AAGB32_01005 [Pseudomonadota bacterium]
MSRFLLLFLLLFTSSIAQAQESQIFIPPGSTFENEALQIIEANRLLTMQQERKIVPTTVYLSLVHENYMEPDQFGILMKTPDIVTGCYDVSPLSYEAKFVDNNYLDVKVDSFKQTPIETQNVVYGCNQSYKTSTGLLLLSISDLLKRNIREIRFSNGGVRDNYSIHVDGNTISLRPDTTITFKTAPKGKQNPISHIFGKGGVIALQVPMANHHDDVEQAVRNMAARYALNPIFDDERNHHNVFYFEDRHGRAANLIEADGYGLMGEIGVARPYIGANGREQRAVPLKVFVTKADIIL